MLHPEKAPPGWEMSPPELPTPTIPPHTLQLVITTEFATLDSCYALNFRISASIDMDLFSHLEDVRHIDSGASNHITRDRNNFSDYRLSSSEQKIWTGGGALAVEGYDSVAMDWITRKWDRVPVILTNVLNVPGIITNLISVRKLDFKGIYWRSRDQTLRIVKINREVGVFRTVGDLYAVMTDLHKVRHQATHLRDVIRNDIHYFTPSSVGISCDQATLKEESVEKITNIPRCEDREPPGLLKDNSLQQMSDLPEHPPVKEGRVKSNTQVPARY